MRTSDVGGGTEEWRRGGWTVVYGGGCGGRRFMRLPCLLDNYCERFVKKSVTGVYLGLLGKLAIKKLRSFLIIANNWSDSINPVLIDL